MTEVNSLPAPITTPTSGDTGGPAPDVQSGSDALLQDNLSKLGIQPSAPPPPQAIGAPTVADATANAGAAAMSGPNSGSFGEKMARAANQLGIPPGPSGWAKSLVGGAQSALAGVGSIGVVPHGAGALYGIGKVMQAGQAEDDKKAEQAAIQRQRDIENARQGKATDAEILQRQATTAHENVMAQKESFALSQLKGEVKKTAISDSQKELASDLDSPNPPPVLGSGLTADQINAKIQSGQIDPAKAHRYLDGQKEVGKDADGDPIMQDVYTVTGQGGPQTVSKDMAARYKAAFPNRPPLQTDTSLSWEDYKYQKQLISNVETAQRIEDENKRVLGIKEEGEK